MSRAIPLPESPTLDELDEEDDNQVVAEEIRQNLPSWLTSLVFHLALVLLLALFTVAGKGSLGNSGIALDVTTGGGDPLGAEDGALEAALELPSELASAQTTEALAPAEFAQEIEQMSQIDLVDVQNVGPTSAANLLGQGGGSDGGAGGGDDGGDGTIGRFPITTGVFGIVSEGTRFIYVFDRSESMNSTFSYQTEGETVFSITPLVAAKAELLRSLNELDERQQFHLLFYNHEVWPFDTGNNNKLIPANAKNREAATQFINNTYGAGQTNHMPALEVAIRLKPDVIFLMTDGEEKDDPSRDQLKRLRNLNKGHAKINVVQFCYEARSTGTLVQLANENGGKHIFMTISQLGPGMAAAADAGKKLSAPSGPPGPFMTPVDPAGAAPADAPATDAPVKP
jgi:hypothetical protein